MIKLDAPSLLRCSYYENECNHIR